MSAASLEDRIKYLEDKDAIKDLVYTWTFYVNKGWNDKVANVDAMPLIYTEDVSGGMPQMNSEVRGLKQLMTDLRVDTADIIVSMHSMGNGIIKIDGDSATGNWLMQIYVRRESGTRQLYMSVEHKYVRTPDGWRINHGLIYVGGMVQS